MIRLLIVEDDYMTLEGIVKVTPWSELGITLLKQADDGVNALEIAGGFRPDIVLSDIRMPRMNGIEFASRIREIEPRCKIIFMSAFTDREYYKSAIKLKAVSFVEKPIDMTELTGAIQNAVMLCREDSEKADRSNAAEKALSSSLPLVKRELALSLRNKGNLIQIKEKLNLLSLDVNEDYYFVTILIMFNEIANETYPPEKSEHDSQLCLVEDLVIQNGLQAIAAFMDDSHIIAHLYTQPENRQLFSQEGLERLCSSIHEAMKNNYSISIASGGAVKGMQSTCYSYGMAEAALKKVFFNTQEYFCSAEDGSLPYIFEDSFLDSFADSLARRDKNSLRLLVKKLSGDLRLYPNTQINTVKNFFFCLLLQLQKSADSEGIPLVNTENNEDFIWNVVSKCNFLKDLEDYVNIKIEAYFKSLEKKFDFSPTVMSILDYIHAHYHEQTLSTSKISANVYLSSSYICVLFKEETGRTISNYITEFRVEQSKKLLRDASLKVADIAWKVGFQEGDYFAKIFRKIEGTSPSEYRERLNL